jgi:hypothetical protein
MLGGLLCSGVASAHKASDSYLFLKTDGPVVHGEWDIALRDLDYAIGIDANGDGSITWGEVKAAREAITSYALSRLKLADAEGPCELSATDLRIAEHSDGRYAALMLEARCAQTPKQLTLRYDLLFDLDAQHRGLLNLDFGGGGVTGVFAPDTRELRFDAAGGGTWRVFTQYLREGLFHVWSGMDHMLFLAGLFLPAVLRRVRGADGRYFWQPADRLGPALRETAGIVTAFTIAHATTLTLAATGAFSPPSRLIESLVAATVLFAGLNNLLPMVHRRLFVLAGFFGLIHGSAVAGALIELGLPATGRVWALLAFNLGVEAAQLALIAVVVPTTFVFRNSVAFRRFVLVPSSIFVALAGLAWLIERGLAVNLHIPLP